VQDASLRPRAVAKLMFMHMMGYPTHFGQMECLKLISSTTYYDKVRCAVLHACAPLSQLVAGNTTDAARHVCAHQRIGYLGLTQLLDERAEVLLLVTNSIKTDLASKNPQIVALALCAMAAVASPEMSRDLAIDVENLLHSENAYIRKKAALCAIRVLRKAPELAEGFFAVAPTLLKDRHHGALLASLVFCCELCTTSHEAVSVLRLHLNAVLDILRALTTTPAGSATEHSVGGVHDPFLQVACLRLLRLLSAGDADASDAICDVLASVATTTAGAKSAGTAVLYECVRTIMGVDSISSLRTLGVNILGRLLSATDNNSRYVALQTLAGVVVLEPQAVQRHRGTIVECVRDADVSIRRRALDLVYALVNPSNVEVLVKELIAYLPVADVDFKPGIAKRICGLAAQFAPSKRWHLDSLIACFAAAGKHASEDDLRGACVLVANAPELHGYAARRLFSALSDHTTPVASSAHVLAHFGVWTIGEFGDFLVSPDALVAAPLLEGEDALVVTDIDVVAFLEALMLDSGADTNLRSVIVVAATKLAQRCGSGEGKSAAAHQRLSALVAKHSTSIALELQQRSVELSALLVTRREVQDAVLERMPPPDEASWKQRCCAPDANGNIGTSNTSTTSRARASSTGGSAASRVERASGSEPRAAGKQAGLLNELLGQLDGSAAAEGAAAAAAAAAALADVLGSTKSSTSTGEPRGPYGTLGEPMCVYARNGVTVTFQCAKPPGSEANVTQVTGVYTYEQRPGCEPVVTDFILQAAVPKVMTLTMGPATGSTLRPGASPPVTQGLSVVNSQYGVKPLVMKLRLSYNLGTQAVAEDVTVTDFPPGA